MKSIRIIIPALLIFIGMSLFSLTNLLCNNRKGNNLGQSGARKLQMLLLSKNAQWLHESGLVSITLDADSTVKSVCGNQEELRRDLTRLIFIDWIISVPAKITKSGHQIEIKMYSLSRFIGKHHFYKEAWEEFDKLIEAA